MYSEISTVINFAKNHNNRRPHKKKKSETGKRGSEAEGGEWETTIAKAALR
jgi:hypothetical protein